VLTESFLPKWHELIALGRALQVIFRSEAKSATVFICLHLAVLISNFWRHELVLACEWRRVSKAKIRQKFSYLPLLTYIPGLLRAI
jgi:hypothetical protein